MPTSDHTTSPSPDAFSSSDVLERRNESSTSAAALELPPSKLLQRSTNAARSSGLTWPNPLFGLLPKGRQRRIFLNSGSTSWIPASSVSGGVRRPRPVVLRAPARGSRLLL